MVGIIQMKIMRMLLLIGITMLIFSLAGVSSATENDIEVKITNIWGSNYPIVLFGQSATLGQVVSADLDSSPISEPLPTYVPRIRNQDKTVVSRFKISDTKVKIVADIASGTGAGPGSEGYIKINNPDWKITEKLPADLAEHSWFMNTGYNGHSGTGVTVDNVTGTISWSGRADCYCGDYENGVTMTFIVENVALKSSLTITKSATPYSIRQFQESTVKILIENTGTSEVKAIEIIDSIHPSFDLTGGDFPNPKKFVSIRAGESRELQYTIKSKESGAFTLDPATVTYADSEGNIQEMKSEPVSIKVVPSSEGSPEIPSTTDIGTTPVLLHGEKTDVVLGEDILLKLSAVNLITKPPMSVQVMIYPPSGMSVTGSEFVESGAGIYSTTYALDPGKGKDIEVHIKSNQVGDFNVKGRIVYYFGEEKEKAEDHTLNLPIKVRKEALQQGQTQAPTPATTTPGFEAMIGIISLLFIAILIKRWR